MNNLIHTSTHVQELSMDAYTSKWSYRVVGYEYFHPYYIVPIGPLKGLYEFTFPPAMFGGSFFSTCSPALHTYIVRLLANLMVENKISLF